MDQLEKIIKQYQQNFGRAEFYQQHNGRISDALKYYNKAIDNLLDAKELLKYSKELNETAKLNKDFASWLQGKKLSIEKQLDDLLEHVKILDKSTLSPKAKKKQTTTRDNWENLCHDSIRLLCHLRSKLDFGGRNKDFEKMLDRHSKLLNRKN